MHPTDDPTLSLPLQAVTNPAFPYESRLEHARRFLASRGITAVRPVYGARSKSPTLNDRLGARPATRFDGHRAANDDDRAHPPRSGDSAA
jgi:hypothetical protein